MTVLTLPDRCACTWVNTIGTPEWHLKVRHPGCQGVIHDIEEGS